VTILDCLKQDKQKAAVAKKEKKDGEKEKPRATQTTGIVARTGDRQIAWYRSGRQHAGENLDDLLKKRNKELGAADPNGRRAESELEQARTDPRVEVLGACIARVRFPPKASLIRPATFREFSPRAIPSISAFSTVAFPSPGNFRNLAAITERPDDLLDGALRQLVE
jgi:hypothetical protein